jgi:hypothetical protein
MTEHLLERMRGIQTLVKANHKRIKTILRKIKDKQKLWNLFKKIWGKIMKLLMPQKKTGQEQIRTEIKFSQEEMRAGLEQTIALIRYELEETTKNWVKVVLSSVEKQTKSLHEEFNVKIKETQLDLQ